MLPQETYKRIAVIIMYVFASGVLLWVFFSYLWGAFLPFVLAYVFAECLRPMVKFGETRKKFPTRLFVLLFIVISASAVVMLLWAIINEIYGELTVLAQNIKNTLSRMQSDENFASDIIGKISSAIPFADVSARLWEIRENLDTEIGSFLLSFADRLSGNILPLLGGLVGFVPNALLVFAAFVISAYYFAVDRVKISTFVLSLFPSRIRPKLKNAKDELSRTVFKYLRAYGLIFLITFAELLVSFLLIGIKYSFVLALVVSIVDILPVVGTGTVLIPWAAYCLLAGDSGRGIALLASYAVITVVRQLIEPKIVGKYIGLHPLLALMSMYIGLYLLGVAGLFIFPLCLILLTRLLGKKKANSDSPPATQ